MRGGDALLLLIIAISLLLVIGDGTSGGAVSGWIETSLYDQARGFGAAIRWIGWGLLPFLALPLLAGLLGRFAGLPNPLENLFNRIIGLFDSVSTVVGDAARWLALALVVVTATVVIQRYVFGFASTKLQESIIYLHALLFLLASGSTLLADGHVRVDIIYSKLSERGKAWTDMIGTYLALFPMALLILWVSTPYINASWRILERSRESDGLPLVFMLKTAIPVFAVLMILQGLSMAMRAALVLSGKDAPPVHRTAGQEP
ncbi:TRAP transporter small permease subunit [Hyphobacterium sp. HN65]|uniref:TRAP transporter small permease protein n=1 Tax=Hyphobacterium lacteum TaxID=3116575 RepID=A0ABU7LN55_9PROT|nr:TRAP transporter small permease subunit [Hyphobacterium sp. HN65]MEE2525046.1 TRAP transporter small permease subunit [Hyphobacterium sp. HN65]